jgi:hypothetical protein
VHSAFPSSPRSLVAVPAPKRQRTPRWDSNAERAEGRRALSDVVEKTLRLLGDLGVWIVSAISRRRFRAEEAEDAETDSNAERAEVGELFWVSSTKLSASSAHSAFRSSPRSLVPAAASRRRRLCV